jgi:hypothetical protein
MQQSVVRGRVRQQVRHNSKTWRHPHPLLLMVLHSKSETSMRRWQLLTRLFVKQFPPTLDEKHELPPQQLLPSCAKSPSAGARGPTPVKAQRLLDCQGLVLDGFTKRTRTVNTPDLLQEGCRLDIAEAMHNRTTPVEI